MHPSDERFEDGINGNYDFDIRAVLTEAWQRTKGVKRIYFVATLLYVLFIAVMTPLIGTPTAESRTLVQVILPAIVYAPIVGGVTMLGARRAVDLPVSMSTLFAYTSKTLPIAVVAGLFALVDWSMEYVFGFFASIVVVGFIGVFTAMTFYLIADRDMGPFDALMASIKACSHKWIKLTGLLLIGVLIMVVSALPLGIGLIWSLPTLGIAYGIVYREMFGVNEAISERQEEHQSPTIVQG